MEQNERNEPEILQESQDIVDIDISAEDLYDDDQTDNRPDYPPRKNADVKKISLGALAVAVIIGLTWYAFNTSPTVDINETDSASSSSTGAANTAADFAENGGSSSENADTIAFTPTPETIAAAEAAIREAEAKAAADRAAAQKAAAEAKLAEVAAAAAANNEAKSDNAEPAETVTPEDTAVDNKPAEGEAAESKPAEAKPAETKPAESKPAEAKPVETKPAESKPAEAKPVETKSAESKPAETATAATVAISEKWVVNISSTPDSSESHKLLMRVLGNDLGGQVYSYETTIEGKLHYRIRVGFFDSKAEAEAAGQKFYENFKLSSTPWAVQPTVEEVERYNK